MVKDAESHAAEDKARRELIDARNQADSLAYSVEKTVEREPREAAGRRASSRSRRRSPTAEKAVQGDDLAAITTATDELQRASHAMAEALYKATQAGGRSRGPTAGGDGAQARGRRSRRRGVRGDEVTARG